MTPCQRHLIGTSLALLGAWFVADGRAEQAPAGGQGPDRVAALKQSMAASQKQLRQYEWIETTIISMKGEEKSRKQQRCYYGADGKVQKVPIDSGQAAQQSSGGGGRRRGGGRVKESIVENKKEGIQDYMEQAAGLIHQYVPPNPELIEKSKAAGKVATRPGAAGQVGLDFNDYLKPGDRLSVELDGANNRLLGLNVASYLESPEDVVTLAVQFATLPDGTSYTAQTTLDAKAKNIRVVTQNSGHRPVQK